MKGIHRLDEIEVKFLQFFAGTKYKLVDYGIAQLQKIVQPYVVTGLGFNVPLSRTSRAGVDTNGDGKPDISLSSLGLPGAVISGITHEAPELLRRGLPFGSWFLRFLFLQIFLTA